MTSSTSTRTSANGRRNPHAPRHPRIPPPQTRLGPPRPLRLPPPPGGRLQTRYRRAHPPPRAAQTASREKGSLRRPRRRRRDTEGERGGAPAHGERMPARGDQDGARRAEPQGRAGARRRLAPAPERAKQEAAAAPSVQAVVRHRQLN
ncbi:hypothetical protein DFJ74DRAFT_766402, partial [Hyaloraphidium curvatum]